jgi:hypothetical protein
MSNVTCLDCQSPLPEGDKYCIPCDAPVLFGPRELWGVVQKELDKEERWNQQPLNSR